MDGPLRPWNSLSFYSLPTLQTLALAPPSLELPLPLPQPTTGIGLLTTVSSA